MVGANASIVTTWWLVKGIVNSALRTKGVRKQLYRLAFNNHGYYDGAETAFRYNEDPDDDTLFFHILFKSEEHAINFDVNLKNEALSHKSPLCHLTIEDIIQTHNLPSTKKRIQLSDYIPEDSSSPTVDLNSVTSASEYSLLEMSSDIFRYQRIETLAVFPSGFGRAQKRHLIGKKECRIYESYSKYEFDDNNLLALSSEFHDWFDGLNTHLQLPLLKVDYISCSERMVLDDRYKVDVMVEAIDINCSTTIFPRLKEGSSRCEDGTKMLTFVYVKNAKIFKKCLEWKAINTQRKWDKFRLVSDL